MLFGKKKTHSYKLPLNIDTIKDIFLKNVAYRQNDLQSFY